MRNDSYTGGSRCGNRIINGYEHAREISPGGAQLLETPPEVREEAKPTTERKVGYRYVIYVKPRRGDTRPLSLTSQSAPLSLSACVASPRLDYICSFYPPTLSLSHFVPSFSGGVSNSCAPPGLWIKVLCFIIRNFVILYTMQKYRTFVYICQRCGLFIVKDHYSKLILSDWFRV